MMDSEIHAALKKLVLAVAGSPPVAIAYVIAPLFVLTIGLRSTEPADLFGQPDGPLALVAFRAGLDAQGHVVDRPGLLVLMDTGAQACAIPFSAPSGHEVFTSMEAHTLVANRDILHAGPSLFRTTGRLLGAERAAVYLPGARPNGPVSFPGREVAWEALCLPSQRSTSVAAWSVVASLGVFLSVLLDRTKGESVGG